MKKTFVSTKANIKAALAEFTFKELLLPAKEKYASLRMAMPRLSVDKTKCDDVFPEDESSIKRSYYPA